MARSRYRFGQDPYPYFMTQTIVGWLPVFSEPRFVDEVIASWNFLQSQRGIQILAYVIMENHLHWIAAGDRLGECVGKSKSFIARRIIDSTRSGTSSGMLRDLERLKLSYKSDQQYQLWQEGSHPQRIDSDDLLWQKIEYIHNNPLRRRYVEDPTHWRYSSARNYAQLPSIIDINTQWY
jgi:putative transposase